jgi:hypothetical protein
MTATTAPGRAGLPHPGWLIACSLWLLPVLFGVGMTSWIGFGLIGILVVRMRWVLLAGAWLVVLSWLEIEPESLPRFIERTGSGYFDAGSDIPLLLLYVAGVAYGLHANRVWLRILWRRRESGARMLGWSPAPARVRASAARHAAATPVPAAAPDVVPPWVAAGAGAVVAAPVAAGVIAAAPAVARDERAELFTRAAAGFRALLAREEQRMRSLLSAAAAAPVVAAATEMPLPMPTTLHTKLPTSTLFPPSPPPVRTTLLGLPSQPVDVRTATVEEIAAIPAIGPERAAQLVAARGTHPLDSVDDVVKLLGLTGVDRVRAHPYLRF